MSVFEEILSFNRKFVDNRDFEQFATGNRPDKKLAILSCMDTRLTHLLPAALGLKNGDAKIIKNAGGVIMHPFGSVMLSLMVAVYELGVEEIMVVGHYDCGMQGLDPEPLIAKMLQRGISPEALEMVEYCGIDLHSWLSGFDEVEASVRHTAEQIRNHPLMPKSVEVRGFVMDPQTGELFPQ
ncbi:MAG: carbonic anhydrase [Oscillospiraceae bacterium]